MDFAVAAAARLRHKCVMATKYLASLDVLVIADETLLRKQIAAHLESLGADVTGAGTLEAMRLGAVGYLVKPFDVPELPLNPARCCLAGPWRR